MYLSLKSDIRVDLDAVFAALSDPTRRDILKRLSQNDLSVKDIATDYDMSQPAISKHLKVLERAELIERRADGQSRLAALKADTMEGAVNWLREFEEFWTGSLDQLDVVLAGMPDPKESKS